MPHSLATLPLRVSLRATRLGLRWTREAAELGLAALELVDQALTGTAEEASAEGEPGVPRGAEVPRAPRPPSAPREPPPAWAPREPRPASAPREPRPASAPREPRPVKPSPAHVSAEPELVAESAEPGAESGAGAAVRIDAPYAGYGSLRAADVVARLGASDSAELAAIKLYETAHRRRKTVLDAVARELRRRRT